jgi:hypothetical protein
VAFSASFSPPIFKAQWTGLLGSPDLTIVQNPRTHSVENPHAHSVVNPHAHSANHEKHYIMEHARYI